MSSQNQSGRKKRKETKNASGDVIFWEISPPKTKDCKKQNVRKSSMYFID